MSHQSEPKIIKARKAHRCSWCADRIEPGSSYESTFIVCEGEPWGRKMHLECAAAERSYNYDGDVLYYEGQFQRGHNHEPNWSSVEDGVRNKCPGCIAMLSPPNTEMSGNPPFPVRTDGGLLQPPDRVK